MKVKALAGAAGVAISVGATAAPLVLPQNTPLFFQYVNAEQISPTNQIDNKAGGKEGNWGIAQITSIQTGTALNPPGSDIQGGGAGIFADGFSGGQILGIFYDIDFINPNRASGGRFDLYWWEGVPSQNTGTELNSGANLAKRTAQNEYTGFTCAAGNTANCTLLASLDFASGSEPGAPGVTVATPVNPATTDGVSKSYLSISTAAGRVGAWTAVLDTNYFTLDPCNKPVGYNYAAGESCPTTGQPITGPGGISMTAAQDVRLDNNFTRNGATAWDGLAADGSPILGLRSNDPGRTYTAQVPEPGSLALVGLSLLGLVGLRRTRKS